MRCQDLLSAEPAVLAGILGTVCGVLRNICRKDEYHSLPAEERTFANKVSIAYKHLSSVESTYDSAVSSVVSEMRRVLREYNQPETVADQAWSYYQSAKSSMISSLGG